MYGSLELANTYFNLVDFNDSWIAFSDSQKIKALELATKQIDRLTLHGVRYEIDQDKEFPREYYESGNIHYWEENRSTGAIQVPEDIKEATYIQAKFLLEYKDSARLKAQKEGVSSLSVGSTSESYDLSKPIAKQELCQEAYKLVEKYLLRYI